MRHQVSRPRGYAIRQGGVRRSILMQACMQADAYLNLLDKFLSRYLNATISHRRCNKQRMKLAGLPQSPLTLPVWR